MEYTQENNEKTVKESGFNINLRDIVELIIANGTGLPFQYLFV